MAAGAVQVEGYGDPCPGGVCAVPSAAPASGPPVWWPAGGLQGTASAVADFRALEDRIAAQDAAAAIAGARVAAQLGPVDSAPEVRGSMTFDAGIATAVFGGIADVFKAQGAADVARQNARLEASRVAAARPVAVGGLSVGGLLVPALVVVGVLAALRMVTRR